MLDLDEINAHIEAMNLAPRMTVDDLNREIAAHQIQIAPRVLERVKRSLKTPREPYQLTDRTIAAIEKRALEGTPRDLKLDRVPEITVFFWARQNSGRLASFSEIGVELELSASVVSSAIQYLLDEGLVESQHAPRDLTRYSYRAMDFRRALGLVWGDKAAISTGI